jgi:death-on-curing protein
MEDPIWISVELALSIHARQLAEHGGADGTRDQGLLESALAKPRQRFSYIDPTPEVPELAATLAFGIARNHPFIDGNKRTSAVVCEVFLNLNGYELTASDEEMYEVFLQMSAGDLVEEAFTQWLVASSRRA